MTRDEWKKEVLDAIDSYTYSLVHNGGEGRQSYWDRILELLDQQDKS
jgi:hypothetical protein